MKLADLSREIRESLGAFEGFRRAGFTSEQIRFGVHDGKLIVQLHWRKLVFNTKILDSELSDEAFQGQWTSFIEGLLPTLPEIEIQDNWDECMMAERGREVLLSLEEHGISYPAHPKWRKLN